MRYEIRNINGEQWLISIPSSNNANEIDHLEYALANLSLHTKDNNCILKLPQGRDNNEIALKLITSLLYEYQRHHWDDAPCLYRRIAIELMFPACKGWIPEQYQAHLKQQELAAGDYFGEELSDNSDNEDEALRKKIQ